VGLKVLEPHPALVALVAQAGPLQVLGRDRRQVSTERRAVPVSQVVLPLREPTTPPVVAPVAVEARAAPQATSTARQPKEATPPRERVALEALQELLALISLRVIQALVVEVAFTLTPEAQAATTVVVVVVPGPPRWEITSSAVLVATATPNSNGFSRVLSVVFGVFAVGAKLIDACLLNAELVS
jgi:hypothetical protein